MTHLTMLQDEAEIDAFAALLKTEGAQSYLEVGAKFGGSLQRIASQLQLSRAVAVDLPNGTGRWRESKPALERVIGDLKARGCDARVIWGDSTDAKVVEAVRELGPFDAVFIDANHTYDYVTKDFTNYGPMGRIIAFHDIAWRRDNWQGEFRIDVPLFWEDIKRGYRHLEFKLCPTGTDNGIGVIWRST